MCRLPPLRAQVEIAVAADDLDTARAAADELDSISARYRNPYSAATAACARAMLLLARGDAAGAADAIRPAIAAWNELGGRYEIARARIILADALAATGDAAHAMLELHAASASFGQLGAQPDLRRADARLAELSRTSDAVGGRDEPGERVARTFVFTDIVDSTKLAEALGDEAWARLVRLARHRGLLGGGRARRRGDQGHG